MSLFKNQAPSTRTQNPMSLWQQEMNSLFDRFNRNLGDFDFGGLDKFSPKIEVKEKDKNYTVFAEVPGIKEDDINVTLRDNNLILEGERKSENTVDEEDFHKSEFSYGSFYRSIPLTDEINPDSVKASYKDGILKVEMDKVKPSNHKSKKIPILKS